MSQIRVPTVPYKLVLVSKLKAGQEADSNARSSIEIEDGRGLETKFRIWIRIKSVTWIKITNNTEISIESGNEIGIHSKVYALERNEHNNTNNKTYETIGHTVITRPTKDIQRNLGACHEGSADRHAESCEVRVPARRPAALTAGALTGAPAAAPARAATASLHRTERRGQLPHREGQSMALISVPYRVMSCRSGVDPRRPSAARVRGPPRRPRGRPPRHRGMPPPTDGVRLRYTGESARCHCPRGVQSKVNDRPGVLDIKRHDYSNNVRWMPGALWSKSSFPTNHNTIIMVLAPADIAARGGCPALPPSRSVAAKK
ncbi:hypothetical protein EVAR_22592_1 [Eumeta japonica]|uniref:Uncharacterized protein n=1 Tax=Eumeta variegata TaxID=151549 RepID=A0A4C1U8T7_EUMVA|nr:hypothetical protein EVAR_22592_1 [Eumeta japonica]